MQGTLAHKLAATVAARDNCEKCGNWKWRDIHMERAEALVKKHMPSGAGFDAGTQIDWDRSNRDQLVFVTSFHHMNDCGMYDGWTEHSVTVRACLVHGIELNVSGRNRNDIKDYIAETFDGVLRLPIADD